MRREADAKILILMANFGNLIYNRNPGGASIHDLKRTGKII